MLFAFTSAIIAITVLFFFYACFGFGKNNQNADGLEMAYALEELNPSDYHSYAVNPAKRKK